MASLNKAASLPGPSKKLTDDGHPYGLMWLDSFFQEVFLPNGAWQKVALKVNALLAEKIKKQFSHAKRKQMIFELMGQDFVQLYFPNEEYNPRIIEVPEVSPEERKKLQIDAQNWLQKELTKVTEEAGCQRPGTLPENQSVTSPEMLQFLHFVRYLAVRDMDKHLHLQEKEILKSWEDYQWEQHRAKEEKREAKHRIRLQREYERITGAATAPRSILRSDSTPYTGRPPQTAESIFTTVSQASNKTTSNIKGAIYGAEDDPPTFWGMQSNSTGRSLIALLKRDPRRYNQVAVRLHGHQLPGTLRTYLWLDMLLRSERDRLKDVNAEKLVRERFGKALSRGIGDLRVKRATHSPISGLIDNAVIEIYDRTPGMRSYLEQDQHLKESARALNVLYVYDRTYEPYMICWLFPLQIAFQDFSGQSEHVYDLAMYLDLLNKGCFPKWPQVFAVAERAMERLQEADKELYDHLEAVSLVNVNISPKEFLVQMIHEEKTKADAILAASQESRKLKEMSKDLLANPRIFLRKWVGEGFVSVLDTQAAIYVWDQCFLQRWEPRVLEDFCLALLLLLRQTFLKTCEYKEMKQVFLREPCKVYTMDIQRAWIHIQRQGDYDHVAGMNRQAPRDEGDSVRNTPVRRVPSPLAVSPAPSMTSLKPLPSLGIKYLRLNIDIPPERQFLSSIQPSSVKLVTTVYFGSVRLAQKTSHQPGQSTGVKTDKYGNSTFNTTFPQQKFIFDAIETSQYDLEEEMGGYPYAIIQATGLTTARDGKDVDTSLGWARIKLFQHRSEVQGWADPSGQSEWILLTGDYWYNLYSGDAPEQGVTSAALANKYKPVIGQNSQLGALVYDPDAEPATPVPVSSPSPLPPPPESQPPDNQTPAPKQATPTPSPAPQTTPQPASPELPGIKDTFMAYIDGVDNIPDNATITKVTGRFIRTGSEANIQDVLAFPELESRARYPRYKYSHIVNADKVTTDVDMVLLLRVYTVNRHNLELEVIGSCLCEVFDKQTGKLRVGSHQRILHYGMPDLSKGLSSIHYTSLDTATRIPGCSLFYRLSAYQETPKSPPEMTTINYPLDDVHGFNQSEQWIKDSYLNDGKHPKTTSDMIKRLQTYEKATDTDIGELAWLQNRLDQKVHLPPNKAAEYLAKDTMVRYRLNKGICLLVSGAYGLNEGLYIKCFVLVNRGEETRGEPPTAEGHGKDDEKMVTLKTDLDSFQVAPRWKDDVKMFHPHCDRYTVLLVQLFGLKMKYTATADHKAPGKLTEANGGELVLNENNIIGWGIVPIFKELYVNQGEHHIPLFRGKPDPDLLAKFSSGPVDEVIKAHTWTDENTLGAASLVIKLWDGHFRDGERLDIPKRDDTLLVAMSDSGPYYQAEREAGGAKLSQFIVDALSPAEQKEGTSGQAYQQEEKWFAELIEKTSTELMESALLEAGYGPL